MRVPADVPPDVPATAPTGVAADVMADAPARRGRARHARKRNDGTAPHLTGGPGGWRFQIRVPTALLGKSSRVAGVSATIRASLGPLGRGEAKRLARLLATICEAVFAMATAKKETDTMTTPQSPDDNGNKLVEQVIDACQQAIKQAVAQPSRAIGLAQGLGSALTALQLVQTEVGRGQHGAGAVVQHADVLARGALKDVLAHATDPKRAHDILDTTSVIVPFGTSAPNETSATAPPPPPRSSSTSGLPKFSEVSHAYIAMRIERDGADHPDIPVLEYRRGTFLDINGDPPIDQCFQSHLKNYVNKLQFLPANVAKRSEFAGKSTLEILEANKDLKFKPMSEKTMRDGYVANIRTMARHLMGDLNYRDPFAGPSFNYPGILRPSKPREGIGTDVINSIFRNGVSSGLLDEAMLPPLAKLTSRREGLLIHLQGADIRQKHGVWIAQVAGVVLVDGHWRRVPVKTDESVTFFVLHNFLVEIGWVDWARKQEGWLFAAAHEHPDPSKYISKAMGRLLRRSGTQAGEVFHSLRGDAIDEMRGAKVKSRARRLQSGHQLGDEHDKYGFRALKAADCKRLAEMPLPEGIDWDLLRGLDFDVLAKARRGPGRRRR